ncbi:Tas retrotransposon peptidase A16 [Trichostrongylus colubriformis]|uniref:Tas retrotransposon peptidase A16 n=1 Tax=Trichostrongylus colubriformis TaxID=6319 RepID=A0AAN8IK52_TRICO
MELLFNTIEDVLSGEEMVNFYIDQSSSTPQTTVVRDTKKQGKPPENLCMFCKGGHKPMFCSTYKTPRERAKYLRDQRLCQLCASPHHKSTECKRRNCFKCGGAHHTSCCFSTSPEDNAANESPQQKQAVHPNKSNTTKRQVKGSQKVNVVVEREQVGEIETDVLEVQSSQEIQQFSTTILPIGEVKVVDNRKGKLRNIPVLLDTGAEISFIDNALADELQLQAVSEKTILLHTFGSKRIEKKRCRLVHVEVQDVEGKYHDLELLTHDSLTKPMRSPPLLEEDLQFIKSLNLSVTYGRKERQIQPLILLGCDQGSDFFLQKLATLSQGGTDVRDKFSKYNQAKLKGGTSTGH